MLLEISIWVLLGVVHKLGNAHRVDGWSKKSITITKSSIVCHKWNDRQTVTIGGWVVKIQPKMR